MSKPTVSVITPIFRGEPYLSAYFKALAAQTLFGDLEAVLVHNQPSSAECALVRDFAGAHPDKVVHVVVDEGNAVCLDDRRGHWALESVAQSMNRAIAAASGEFIALWNVDDIRVPDSLERQVAVLEASPATGLTYGDYVMVARPGHTEGVPHVFPEFDHDDFIGTYAGGFQMWRKSVHEIAGLFDEQLRSGSDTDLWVRIASRGLMQRTPGNVGYYLNAGLGLSTRKDGLRYVEGSVLGLRYGVLEWIDYTLLRKTRHYRIGELHFNGAWHPVQDYFPTYDARIASTRRAWPNELRRQRRARWWRTTAQVWRVPRHAVGVQLRRLGLLPPRSTGGP